jgi:hypothetical protein
MGKVVKREWTIFTIYIVIVAFAVAVAVAVGLFMCFIMFVRAAIEI